LVSASNSKGFHQHSDSNNFQGGGGGLNSGTLATNVQNIKTYNNYHFEIRGLPTTSQQVVAAFLPPGEDSRTLDRIVGNSSLVSNGGTQQQ
jgi:hypothetical protein